MTAAMKDMGDRRKIDQGYRNVSGTSVKAMVGYWNSLDDKPSSEKSSSNIQTHGAPVNDSLKTTGRSGSPAYQPPLHSQRIPVTPSMFHAYNKMRGDRKGTAGSENLFHQSLFPGMSREVSPIPFIRPSIDDILFYEKGESEFFKDTVLYWDPLTHVHQSSHPVKAKVNSLSPNIDFHTYTTLHMSKIGINHFHNDDVYQNFGWIKVNGRWVDSDQKEEVIKAALGEDFEYTFDTYSAQPQRSRPHIMSLEEQEAMYSWFIHEVTDEDDQEGDPRPHRISPEIFQKWSERSTIGDSWCSRYNEPDIAKNATLPKEPAVMPKTVYPNPQQFDIETGDGLSGVYHFDSEAPLLRTPLGVDTALMPNLFPRSLPKEARTIRLEEYLSSGANFENPYSGSEISTPKTFTSSKAYHALNLSPNTNNQTILADLKDIISNTQQENKALFTTARMLRDERARLQREIFFLRRRLGLSDSPIGNANMLSPQTQPEEPQQQYNPHASHPGHKHDVDIQSPITTNTPQLLLISSLSSQPPLPLPKFSHPSPILTEPTQTQDLNTPSPKPEPKPQYKRFMNEQLIESKAELHHQSILNARVKSDIVALRDEIEVLRREVEELRGIEMDVSVRKEEDVEVHVQDLTLGGERGIDLFGIWRGGGMWI